MENEGKEKGTKRTREEGNGSGNKRWDIGRGEAKDGRKEKGKRGGKERRREAKRTSVALELQLLGPPVFKLLPFFTSPT